MKPTVYLETTVIGYLAMRVSGILRVAANQQTTRDWWDNHRRRFDLFVSRFVVDECSDGDPVAAEERLAYLEGIPLLQMSDDVNSLAESLLLAVPLPEKAAIDALHISVAAVNGVQYLLTWNCKHIANPSLRPGIERVCRDMDYEPPVICTPQELLEIHDAI
ncbi:MAG TPA: type II toxin-antitoxin system VapC family toxin [Thermoguttaceae bacterium]|nr:type II toxin-antitoxin system VapC family toxin [Thermoguttaceae bacterium]